MRILCWNYSGIGDPKMVHELRELIQESASSVVCIVETQLSKQRVEDLTAMLGFEAGFVVASGRRNGGIRVFLPHGLIFCVKNFSRYHIDASGIGEGRLEVDLFLWRSKSKSKAKYLGHYDKIEGRINFAMGMYRRL